MLVLGERAQETVPCANLDIKSKGFSEREALLKSAAERKQVIGIPQGFSSAADMIRADRERACQFNE